MIGTLPAHFNFTRDVIEAWAKQRPQALALWCVQDDGSESKLTFGEVSERARRAASFFHQIGLKRGDRVLIILRKVPEWWISMLGLIRLGVVPIPGTPLLTTHDIDYRITASDAAGILTDCEGAEKIASLKAEHKICAGGEPRGWVKLETGLHKADPAFDPEPVSTDDVAAWIAAVVAEVDQTFDQLSGRQADLPPPVRAAAERLLAMRASLKDRIAALAPRVLTFTKTRFHGDFHLGQLLVVEHDFIVVDFEGEPFRPMDERRRKHSPLRDVAGMLRSFSYAAAIALDEATSDRPADRVRAAAHMTRWERETAAAFLTAYARAVRGASSYPSDPVDVARLIDLFVLEKALYEVRYELGSRPDWVRIPIAGLLERMQVAAAVS